MLISYKYHLRYNRVSSVATPISPPPPSTNSSNHTIDISDNEIDDILNDRGVFKDIPNSTPVTTMTYTGIGVEEFSKCQGNTRTGLPCRLTATSGSPYCFRHKQ